MKSRILPIGSMPLPGSQLSSQFLIETVSGEPLINPVNVTQLP